MGEPRSSWGAAEPGTGESRGGGSGKVGTGESRRNRRGDAGEVRTGESGTNGGGSGLGSPERAGGAGTGESRTSWGCWGELGKPELGLWTDGALGRWGRFWTGESGTNGDASTHVGTGESRMSSGNRGAGKARDRGSSEERGTSGEGCPFRASGRDEVLGRQPVADAAHGLDVARIGRVVAELAAEVRHVGLDRALVGLADQI